MWKYLLPNGHFVRPQCLNNVSIVFTLLYAISHYFESYVIPTPYCITQTVLYFSYLCWCVWNNQLPQKKFPVFFNRIINDYNIWWYDDVSSSHSNSIDDVCWTAFYCKNQYPLILAIINIKLNWCYILYDSGIIRHGLLNTIAQQHLEEQ